MCYISIRLIDRGDMMDRTNEMINWYKKRQESMGNNIKDSNRFNPGNDFFEKKLINISELFNFADTMEINPQEKYIILDLMDDIGLYKITIEKLA